MTAYDYDAIMEDLAFLDETGVGATEAARRTGFKNTEAMEKWLTRHGHFDLWQKFKHREAPGNHNHPVNRKRRATTKTKVCNKCGVEQPIANYYKNAASRGGRMAHCISCNNKRPPTVTRMVRNRARSRAYAALAERHKAEFAELYEQILEKARKEHAAVQDAAAAKGNADAQVARLRRGPKREGETSTLERLDVARCPKCHAHHDADHECPTCGDTTPLAPAPGQALAGPHPEVAS